VSATASSGLAVSFNSGTPSVCSVFGSTVTILAVGTCTINANQPGNAAYNAAPQVSQSFNVGKANQTISFSSIANRTIGDAPFNVTASASSGLAVTLTSSTTGVCTISGFTVTLAAPGLFWLQAFLAG
jgi:hypothetical protein